MTATSACKPRAPGIPRRAQLFAWSLVAVTLILLGLAIRSCPSLSGTAVELALLLAALAALAWRYPVRFGANTQIYVSSAATFAAALLLPIPVAAGSAALGIGACELLKRGRVLRQAFNTAALTLNVIAAGAVLRLSPHPFVVHPDVQAALIAALAATVHYAVNAAAVETMGALHQGRGVLAGLLARHRRLLPHRLAIYVLGAFAALVGFRQPLALLFVTVPAWSIYRSLYDSQLLRTQTREAVEQLADIVDMRDRYTFEHSKRVAALSRLTAQRMGLSAAEADEIAMAARVHDVGKIGITSTTLFKTGPLDEAEWAEMRSHPDVGSRLIGRFPDFAAGMRIVRHHHERFDGKGYPDGLAGEAIPLGARLVAVTDTFDAMTSSRAYRAALPIAAVLAELARCRGSQFDPRPLDAFLALLEERPDLLHGTESGRGRGQGSGNRE